MIKYSYGGMKYFSLIHPAALHKHFNWNILEDRKETNERTAKKICILIIKVKHKSINISKVILYKGRKSCSYHLQIHLLINIHFSVTR